MDDETSAILAAKLKGDMEDMIRRVVAEALQDSAFWSKLGSTYPLQYVVFGGASTSSAFANAVKQVMVMQMTK
jgi:hypothetical protein